MLFLLSPAKSLDFTRAADVAEPTTPRFLAQSAELIELLKVQSAAQIAALMKLSAPLAALNVERYAAWRRRAGARQSKPAVLAFDGDVYTGLDAPTLGADDLAWAQRHVAILSGLYGVLRPLDRMQPYRLEMGTRLANSQGGDLYAFWRDTIAAHLDRWVARDASPVIVNLASQEYAKAVDRRRLKAAVIDCVFEDRLDGRWQVIGFHAKRARGAMARYAIRQRAQLPAGLRGFDGGGYAYAAAVSAPDRLVFRRAKSAP